MKLSKKSTKSGRLEKPPSNQLRIIGGEWRGRKLHFSDHEGLRPTSDRVRETLFNWLAPHIDNSQCLDLFSGSGALGFEALSRGAKHCDFIEINPQVSQTIQQQLNILACKRAQTHNLGALNFLKKHNGTFTYDIIFLDPPYTLNNFEQCSKAIEEKLSQQNEKPNTLIYFEDNKALSTSKLPKNWSILKNKKAGKVFFYLLKRSEL